MAVLLSLWGQAGAAERITFRKSADEVDAYDFVEVAVEVAGPAPGNPFTGVEVRGSFRLEGGEPVPVEGFCDADVMWDLSNEYRFLRDDAWADAMGAQLKRWDPYLHAASIHGYGDFRFRKSPWADFAMYQEWDEGGGYRFMLENRRLQAETGRPIPQVNEEYGYEDHYPVGWGGNRKAPARSADNRRRLAWEISMAGCYQTTGERADRGTGWGPDTGGGWINGRGDETMVMLRGYGFMVDFFRSFEWWRTEPFPGLVEGNALCLAEAGRAYALYLPSGGSATVKLEPARYRVRRFNPRSGETSPLEGARGPPWTSPAAPDGGDWAYLLVREAE